MSEEFYQQFHSEISKQSSTALELFPFLSPSDTFAPPADEFDFELDNDPLVAAYKGAHTFVADPTPTFTTLRSEGFGGGPASAFTTDSESAYDSFSTHSGSIYTGSTTYSIPYNDLNMELSNIRMDNGSEYSAQDMHPVSATINLSDSFPSFSSSSDGSGSGFEMSSYSSRSSQSDYEPSTTPAHRSLMSSTSDYNPSAKMDGRLTPRHQVSITPNLTTSCIQTSPQLPIVPSVPSAKPIDHHKSRDDPKKKYQCPNCPRAFARAFNLKTHKETHNPNRAKPHCCPFQTCGRSFSRKHDLGRHLISIHRVDPSQHDRVIGVQRGSRSRCSGCGKSWVGEDDITCGCDFEVR